MCELFGMSSHSPASVSYSLNEFALHGGRTYKNRSGWGIAYYQGPDALIVREPKSASDSPWVAFIARQKLESDCVLAHVRLATVGGDKLENTHPFRQSLFGRVHVFAHNGTLKNLHDDVSIRGLSHRPIGETDSELGFCILMDRMAELWAQYQPASPSIEERLTVFATFASEMRKRGSSNFLYSDGEAMFVHADQRIFEENDTFSAPRPPGLSMRSCLADNQESKIASDGLKIDLADQRTVLFASVPLDDTNWEALPQGTALAVAAGREVARLST